MNAPTPIRPAAKRNLRSFWMRQFQTWHWISAAISLAAMLLFSITGITLNHASTISAEPVVTQRTGQLPAPLVRRLTGNGSEPLSPAVADAVENAIGLDAIGRAAEWSDGEVYVALPRPGGDAWVSIDRTTGAIEAEVTDRGWIAWANDLHKGRNSGAAWFWFIDLFAVACVVFTITGLLLLQMHARRRPSTWPIVIAGLVLPAVLAIFFIH
ncbi:PepSY-associated TM helix domain-containing protein [Sphingomonas sp. Y38-1Y]|uniref:PepSY-associated TM helix domain-containing protein n=1 Tax=Sphingomonas sp. Y38-1Y TaxID=3078265 RepID=UPI0028EF831D|nr:PepSY-associated TM helix domain-containing protein [Sphingomonas sp. Y38-1Y]